MSLQYEPRVQLGHIIQAIAVIVTVGIPTVAAYVSVTTRLSLVESQVSLRVEMDNQWRDSVKGYMRDTSAALSNINQNITNLKVDLARRDFAHPNSPN